MENIQGPQPSQTPKQPDFFTKPEKLKKEPLPPQKPKILPAIFTALVIIFFTSIAIFIMFGAATGIGGYYSIMSFIPVIFAVITTMIIGFSSRQFAKFIGKARNDRERMFYSFITFGTSFLTTIIIITIIWAYKTTQGEQICANPCNFEGLSSILNIIMGSILAYTPALIPVLV